MSDDLQIRQLEYLAALARERHFGRAAKSCFVSQPALSSGIKRLEAELGVTIVLRGQRFQGFTHEGSTVVSWANRILSERDALRDDLDRLRGGMTTTLRLGVIPSAVPVSPMVAQQFRSAHPDAKVRIEGMSAPEISRRLVEFEIDAGLTYLEEGMMPGLRSMELYREHYFALVATTHPLSGSSELTWRDASTLELCTLIPTMRNRQILDAEMALDGVQLQPTVETNDAGAMYAHIIEGGMSSIVSQAWLYAFGIPTGMRALPLRPKSSPAGIGIVALDQTPAPVIVGALWMSLENQRFAEQLEDVSGSSTVT